MSSRPPKGLGVPVSGKRLVQRTLTTGGFEAQFFIDPSSKHVVHYIIAREGSADIVAWGQEKDAHAAERAARDAMHDLCQQAIGRSAAG